MRCGSVVALGLVVLLGTACGSGQVPGPSAPDPTTAVAATSKASATTGNASPAGGPASTRTADRPGGTGTGEPRRFASPQELCDAVLTAVRAQGSVLITTTSQGTSLVSRRSIQLRGGGQDSESRLTIPGQPDQSLLVVDDVPYLATGDDKGPRWMRTHYEDLVAGKVWASAVYAVDLPTELGSWRLATAVAGGDAGVSDGQGVRTYTLTLGPAAAAAQVRLDRVPTVDRTGVAERLAHMQYDLTVTLGADDLPRTVTTVAPVSGLTTTQTYSQWGQVAVVTPTPSDVVTPTS